MVFIFPDSETLRLALTSGAVPPAVSRTAVRACEDADGRLHVEPSVSLSRAGLAELRNLGVDSARTSHTPLTEELICWPQLLPLRKGSNTVARPDQQPILFDMPADHFASLATELLRLGNERQSFRAVKDVEGRDRVLLRVVGPPYYSLLRATENGDAARPTAFVECAPRVWVQFGYRHPLGEHFKPSAGKLLLMSPPRRWTFLDEAPFRDIYEVLDFQLPGVPVAWRESKLTERLTVPLRLTQGGGSEPAELWVLRDEGIAQLDNLVQSADDALLTRLSLAVGSRGGDLIIVLRLRPSKQPPPVLVLNAVGYRPYLKLPNLFLPCGTRLHPPLRRDAVRTRLADDPSLVTWLQPDGKHAFAPESLPDTAFRPLSEWVEYILERERQPLEQWVQSTVFDFEPFICDEDAPPKPVKPPAREPRRADRPKTRGGLASPTQARPKIQEAKTNSVEDKSLSFLHVAEPSELRKKLEILESQFLAIPGPMDVPERQALWPELAELNTALGHDDAAVCWLHALWDSNGRIHVWTDRWLRSEAELAKKHADSLTVLKRAPVILTTENEAVELDRLLNTGDPITAELRGLAAYLLRSAGSPVPSAALLDRLNAVRSFLEQHDQLLPLRAAWKAWGSLAVLAGNDVLTLARARDRLLERLYQNGLRPEQELPSFLRCGGQGHTDRFRSICPWLLHLRESAGECCKRMDDGRLVKTERSRTPACLDLIFAFGLARLGESEAASRLQDRAGEQLNTGEEFHRFLMAAYSYRIRQASTVKPRPGPLPDELLEYLKMKDTARRMPFDRLRQTSRIVEPHLHVRWDRDVLAGPDALAKALNRLPRVLDRTELAGECRKLLHEHAHELADRLRVLEAVLEQAPRVGEEFALDLLRRTVPAYDALPKENDSRTSGARAELLEKALMVAAHFDNTAIVQEFVGRFQMLLSSALGKQSSHVLVSLAGHCLRGLRRLGMRQDTELLLRQLEDLLLQGKNPAELTAADCDSRPDLLPALLHLASGWYYFGHDDQAGVVVNLARGVLFSGPLPKGTNPTPRAELACTYAAVLANAPIEFAQQHWAELFHKLESTATSWHTTPGYCALQMKLVESVVLAVVSDEFTQGAEMRRRLDDDEYLIRKRVHKDLRKMMSV
jgi:hypothetical protein